MGPAVAIVLSLFCCEISLQVCDACLPGQRKRRGAEAVAVAGTGNEGTDLAPGLVLELGIRTGANLGTGPGAGVGVAAGTVRIERSTLRRAVRDGETST